MGIFIMIISLFLNSILISNIPILIYILYYYFSNRRLYIILGIMITLFENIIYIKNLLFVFSYPLIQTIFKNKDISFFITLIVNITVVNISEKIDFNVISFLTILLESAFIIIGINVINKIINYLSRFKYCKNLLIHIK